MTQINQYTTPQTWPQNVEEASAIVWLNLDAGTQHVLKNTEKIDLLKFNLTIEEDIKMEFGLYGHNEDLIKDCAQFRPYPIEARDAARIIIERVHELIHNPDQELLCIAAFQNYLTEKLNQRPPWTRVPRGQDPPDFYMTIKKQNYAVEVTSTKVYRDVSIGVGQVLERTYYKTHKKLVDEIDNLAKEKGVLNGVYCVSFMRPLTSKNFTKIKNQVLEKLLNFIEQTEEDIQTPNQKIRINRRLVCTIIKVPGTCDGVYEGFTNGAWPESPEFFGTVDEIIKLALTDKKQKLGSIKEPIILLLLNTFPLADPPVFLSCLKSIPDKDFFHSIFLVQGDGQGVMLYSKDVSFI